MITPIVYDENGIQIQSGSLDVVKISKTDKKEPLGEPRRAKEKFLMTPSKKGAIYIIQTKSFCASVIIIFFKLQKIL